MVGGNVREVLLREDRIYVNCGEVGSTHHNRCAIYIERSEQSENVKIGDAMWWQGRNALWTPQEYNGPLCGGFADGQGTQWDISLPRIGYSGVHHPAQDMVENAYEVTR